MLYRLRAEPGADFLQRRVAGVPVERRRPDLDQFVRCQRAVDFRDYRVGQPALADMDHGVERVRARLERFPVTRFYLQPFLPPGSFR